MYGRMDLEEAVGKSSWQDKGFTPGNGLKGFCLPVPWFGLSKTDDSLQESCMLCEILSFECSSHFAPF